MRSSPQACFGPTLRLDRVVVAEKKRPAFAGTPAPEVRRSAGRRRSANPIAIAVAPAPAAVIRRGGVVVVIDRRRRVVTVVGRSRVIAAVPAVPAVPAVAAVAAVAAVVPAIIRAG